MCALALVACTLVACGSKAVDPFDIMVRLGEKDYGIYFMINEDDIEEMANEIDVSSRGVEYLIYVEPDKYYDERAGVFIFCEDKQSADKLEATLEDNADEKNHITRDIVVRKGLMIFYGCEDAWEDAQ